MPRGKEEEPRGGVAARGPPVGVLRSAAHRRAESRFWGVFHHRRTRRAFVLGLGAGIAVLWICQTQRV